MDNSSKNIINNTQLENKLLKLEFDNVKENLKEVPLCIEYNIITSPDFSNLKNENLKAIEEIDSEIADIEKKVEKLNSEIDTLTNHADGIDYTVAVASGVLTGIIDSLFVGKIDLTELDQTKAYEQVNRFVIKFANNKYSKDSTLKKSIKHLEENFKVYQDDFISKKIHITRANHHLTDLAHHPSLLGLLCSIFVQFFRVAFFVNSTGKLHGVKINNGTNNLKKSWSQLLCGILMSGILAWIVNIAENYIEKDIGIEIPKPIRNIIKIVIATPTIIPILKTAVNWFGHLVSDVAGTSGNTAGAGMGIPGVFLSFLNELSTLPGFKKLSPVVAELYTKQRLDLRTEISIMNKQKIPVIINECIVRTFYFISNLTNEIKEHKEFSEINWHKVIPIGNRTIIRMITISSATFTAFDVASAALCSGGINVNFILRINIVGVGRFAIAIVTDTAMGIKKNIKTAEVIAYQGIEMKLLNAKVYYGLSNEWIAAKDATEAIIKAKTSCENMLMQEKLLIQKVVEYSDDIKTGAEEIRKNDPELAAEMLKIIGIK